METHTRVYTTHKLGNQCAENQDAFCIPSTDEGYCALAEQRFAVCDGATEAMFSGPWARALAEAWVAGALDFGPEVDSKLDQLSQSWALELPDTSSSWWAEEKQQAGAFTTILGLRLTHSEGKSRWALSAVGDSCLFLIRQNALVFAGPLTRSEEFESSPYLLATSRSKNRNLLGELHTSEGELLKNDELVLATDALSCWLLKQFEVGKKHSDLLNFEEQEDKQRAFLDFVARARESGMKNDDVTLMSIMVRDA